MSAVAKLEFTTKLPRGVDKKTLERAFLLTCKKINWNAEGGVLLGFVDTSEMQELNKQFASNDYPTDVLSFSYSEGVNVPDHFKSDGLYVEGEVIICTEIALKNALNHNVSIKSEVCLLLIHGLLHLSGADHDSFDKQSSFNTIQSGIMKSLNLKYHPMTW